MKGDIKPKEYKPKIVKTQEIKVVEDNKTDAHTLLNMSVPEMLSFLVTHFDESEVPASEEKMVPHFDQVSVKQCTNADLYFYYAAACTVQSEFLKFFYECDREEAIEAYKIAVQISSDIMEQLPYLVPQYIKPYPFSATRLKFCEEVVRRGRQDIVLLGQLIASADVPEERRAHSMRVFVAFRESQAENAIASAWKDLCEQ